MDAVLQIGTGYRVHHRNVATFEDMTIAQAVEHAWVHFLTCRQLSSTDDGACSRASTRRRASVSRLHPGPLAP
ncbi:hypothetical protein GY12_21325 [Micrococcus luteus]|nr:hypothetical protein GY12_21325 [Micrococcus luteus]